MSIMFNGNKNQLNSQAKSVFRLTNWLVVGLGNPGEKYTFTRHNIGFLILDEVINFSDPIQWRKHLKGCYFRWKNIIFLKPQIYMNLSGEVVRSYASFFKIKINNIIIICDEVNLNRGQAKLTFTGSDGGHNGLKSVISCLGSQVGFARIRVGIGGKTQKNQPLEKYVLSEFSKRELEEILPCSLKIRKLILSLPTLTSIEKETNWFNVREKTAKTII